MKNLTKYQIILLAVLIIVSVSSAVFCGYWTQKTEKLLEDKAIENEEKYNKMIEHMKNFDAKQDEEKEKLREVQNKLNEDSHFRKIAFYGATTEGDIQELYFDIDTDLKGEMPFLTADDMNKLIDSWYGGQGLAGRGQSFITAYEQTGLNPIYLFAHAAVESGWGTSYLARTRGNMYGIGAFTNAPGNALYLGDEMDEGIVNGAKWINDNYYNQGACTLSEMKAYGYAEGGSWEHDIAYIVNKSYDILGSGI